MRRVFKQVSDFITWRVELLLSKWEEFKGSLMLLVLRFQAKRMKYNLKGFNRIQDEDDRLWSKQYEIAMMLARVEEGYLSQLAYLNFSRSLGQRANLMKELDPGNEDDTTIFLIALSIHLKHMWKKTLGGSGHLSGDLGRLFFSLLGSGEVTSDNRASWIDWFLTNYKFLDYPYLEEPLLSILSTQPLEPEYLNNLATSTRDTRILEAVSQSKYTPDHTKAMIALLLA